MRLLYLIVVSYGNDKNIALEKLLRGLLVDFNVNIIRVDTSLIPGVFLADPNESFEFSGYQEGLATAINMAFSSGLKIDEESSCTTVFINDTISDAHLPSLSRFLLRELLELKWSLGLMPIFAGLKMPVNRQVELATGSRGYISTWAFALAGPIGIIKRVNFYRNNEIYTLFDKKVAPNLSKDYIDAVSHWLEPVNFFKGWYKSLPGKQLSKATKQRKILTIYLEHALPYRLAEIGFYMVDLGELVVLRKAFFLVFLRRLDRFYLNYLKLNYRLSKLCSAYC